MEADVRLGIQTAIDDMEFGLSHRDTGIEVFIARGSPESQFHEGPAYMLQGLDSIFRLVTNQLWGSNVLTPGLTNRGWKIWKKQPVTPFENEALLAAITKFRDCASGVSLKTQSLGEFSVQNGMELVVMSRSCYRRFTLDLKAVIDS